MLEHTAADGPAVITAVAQNVGPAEAQTSRINAAPLPRQPRLLLVDDDPFMLGVQAHMLRSMGYTQIGTAGSADAALMRVGEGDAVADIVICDLNMPDVDGLEFLHMLGCVFQRSWTPVSG